MIVGLRESVSGTSLRSFLSRDFLSYIILRAFVPGKKPVCEKIIEEHPCHHGGEQLLAPTMACDVRTPQPGASTSSPHHGGGRVHLVWAQSFGLMSR